MCMQLREGRKGRTLYTNLFLEFDEQICFLLQFYAFGMHGYECNMKVVCVDEQTKILQE